MNTINPELIEGLLREATKKRDALNPSQLKYAYYDGVVTTLASLLSTPYPEGSELHDPVKERLASEKLKQIRKRITDQRNITFIIGERFEIGSCRFSINEAVLNTYDAVLALFEDKK